MIIWVWVTFVFPYILSRMCNSTIVHVPNSKYIVLALFLFSTTIFALLQNKPSLGLKVIQLVLEYYYNESNVVLYF